MNDDDIYGYMAHMRGRVTINSCHVSARTSSGMPPQPNGRSSVISAVGICRIRVNFATRAGFGRAVTGGVAL